MTIYFFYTGIDGYLRSISYCAIFSFTRIGKVSCAIASLRSQYIYFPETLEEITLTQLHFSRIAKFPKVVGAIDSTYVKLWQSPGNPLTLISN